MGWLTSVLTIAGAVVGSLVGAPGLGALIGAIVGGVIEGSQSDNPPSIDEIRAMGASEGDGMQYCAGLYVPVAGEMIWRGPLLKKDSDSVGTRYRLPMVISFGRTFTGLAIEKFRRIEANGVPVYWSYDEFNLSSASIAATLIEISSYDPGTGTTSVIQRYLELSGADFAPINVGQIIAVGQSTTIGGFTGGATANNGTFACISATATTAKFKHPTNPLYLFATAAAGPTISVFQPENTGASPGALAGITWEFGYGSVDQAAPAVMQQYEGAANTGNMSGLIWVAFGGAASSTDGFKLDDFGLAVPRFTAILKERNDTDLPTALTDIAVWAGMDPCEVSTVNAVGTFYGFAIRGPKSLRDTLGPFLIHYNLITQEKDFQFVIMHRLAATELDIDEDRLGATDDPQPEPGMPIKVDREDPKRLPAEVNYQYLDRDTKGKPGSQTYRRPSLPLININTMNVPLVADKDQARQVAKRLCWTAAVSSERHGLVLPPSLLNTYESDRLFTTSGGRDRITLLTRILRGNNYLLEMEGRRDDPEMFANEVGSGGITLGPLGGGETATSDPLAVVADMAPLDDLDVAVPLVYVGAVRESSAGAWALSEVHESPSGAGTYINVGEAASEAVAGYVVGTVPTGSAATWDLGAAFTVDFAGQPPPASCTDAQLLAGAANWFLIGGEVIGAATITLVSGSLYSLSRRLRGLMDTAERIASHSASERVIQVRPATGLLKRTYQLSEVGTARDYDACHDGDAPDGVQAVTATLNGSTIRPFSPTYASATRGSPLANDWTVAFYPQTRIPLWETFGSPPFDDAEASEVYVVEVWNSGFAALLRTITSTASANGSVVNTSVATFPTVLYDEQDQVADFGSAQSTIRLRIFQVGSTSLLRSKKLELTLTG